MGFATLPNQVHRKSVKKGFDFTLMVAGKKGGGWGGHGCLTQCLGYVFGSEECTGEERTNDRGLCSVLQSHIKPAKDADSGEEDALD